MPVLGIKNVYAEDPTPEPTGTPTNYPLFGGGTTEVPGDYNCTGNQPLGWGTVTPSAKWLLNCSACVTPIPNITGTPYVWPTVNPTLGFTTPTSANITGTPIPIGTVTETPTSIPTFTNDVQAMIANISTGYDVNPALPNVAYVGGTVPDNSPAVNFRIKNVGPDNYMFGFEYDYSIVEEDWMNYGRDLRWCFNCYADKCEFYDENNVKQFEIGYAIGDNYCQYIYQNSKFGTYSGQVKYNIKVYGYSPYGGYDLYFEGGNAGAYADNITTNRGIYYSEASIFQDILPTPTITPTPYVSDCSEVESSIEGQEMGDEFGFGSIMLGWARCFSFGGWEIPLSWAQVLIPSAPDAWTVPGLEFCFVPIEFGNVSLFGMEISIDFLASAMAGILLFRFITRS